MFHGRFPFLLSDTLSHLAEEVSLNVGRDTPVFSLALLLDFGVAEMCGRR
jgi:hypothetical protein